MQNYLIYSQLKTYAKKDKSFHMPGHKGRGDFKAKFPVANLDVTELSYTDDLFCPKGVIARAQEDIAKILGAKKSRILTDGSSCGVLSMIYAISSYGTKLIVPRGSHQSVWNACRLFNLEPVIVQGEYRDGVLLPPPPEMIEKIISNDLTVAGMVISSPDYYGNIAPLKEYAALLHAYGRYLLVDGAHGAHLAFGKSRAGYAGVYADLWVDGAHKTLPTLTQGAILCANESKLIAAAEEGLSLFRTTSPSFPIMASVEYGVKYLKYNPKAYEDADAAIAAFRAKCPLPVYPSDDEMKLAVDCEPLGVNSDDIAALLEKKGIYPELSDGRYILFYLSPMTTQGELNKLLTVLNAVVHSKKLKKNYAAKPLLPPVERTYSYLYSLKQKHELVPLDGAAGRMCAGNVGISPPCTPVIVAGEIITAQAIKILSGAKGVYGLYGGKIRVVAK